MDDVSAKDITFGDLEMLVAFSRTEHFGRTADELGVSVATVQRAIRTLERKLGVALIEQSGRRVRMLRAGNVLAREANRRSRLREHTRICGCCLRSGGVRGSGGPGEDGVGCLDVGVVLVATLHALEFRLALSVFLHAVATVAALQTAVRGRQQRSATRTKRRDRLSPN